MWKNGIEHVMWCLQTSWEQKAEVVSGGDVSGSLEQKKNSLKPTWAVEQTDSQAW